MPNLKIFTNLSRAQIPRDFIINILLVLSSSMNNRPVELLTAIVIPDCVQSMHVDAVTPSIVANLQAIGGLGREENAIIARDLTDFLVKELGVAEEKIIVTFENIEGYNVAVAGGLRG